MLAPARRSLLESLGFEAGGQLLDVGCGFGMTSVEAAVFGPVVAVGVDIDREVLGFATSATRELRSAGTLASGAAVEFVEGSAYDLPAATGSVDVVYSQYLFQHLSSPAEAANELGRVLKRGGIACLVDTDDGLSITYPPASDAYTRLAEALQVSQGAYGGDRQIGRKLARFLDEAGVEPVSVSATTRSFYRHEVPGDLNRRLLVDRFLGVRTQIIEHGTMDAHDFDATLATYQSEDQGPVCEVEGSLTVIARRR